MAGDAEVSQQYELAQAYVAALTGDINTVMEWRAIHDQDKAVAAIPFRGSLYECWNSMVHYNNLGYGIFATPAAMDGVGRELVNVSYIRAHYVDLDEADASQQFERAAGCVIRPSFCVQSSPGKFHIYWPVQPYVDNMRFQLLQRKLRQFFNGDKRVIDATRVMRVPGLYHCKSTPHLVTCSALEGYGMYQAVEALEHAFAHVNVIDGGIGQRHELGEPSMAAPSLEWLQRALDLSDPNDLDRGDWIAIMSAIKQAGWTLTDPDSLYAIFCRWCERYTFNDIGENLKNWNSIRNTELGWPSLVKRVPSLQALVSFGGQQRQTEPQQGPAAATIPMPDLSPPPLDCSGEFLSHVEQKEWFKGCTYVLNLGLIMTDSNRFLNTSQFNVEYGGKKFIIDSAGKTVTEAWTAATRSTMYQIPKVDHIRFLPSHPHGEILTDDMGRAGINTYKPAKIARVQGDPSPFLWHMSQLLPDPNDQRILLDYLAHNIKYPGHKIPWAFVIQSVEGAGKGVLKRILEYCIGSSYVYFPNAKELTNSGSQFNAWMRNKLFILADEIKVDDRRDLIEVLKPMISEKRIEVQSKGVDQALEDNFANWGFFTNYKNAVPITKNGRRYCVFFSPLQRLEDLEERQMGEWYFNRLYDWLDNQGGAAVIYDWFMQYPIERGSIPMRAPKTSSWDEAIAESRTPMERAIVEAVEDGLPGFRGGWVSSLALVRRIRETGALSRNPSLVAITACLNEMGYHECGRAVRAYFNEDANIKPTLYHLGGKMDVRLYGPMQGYPE